MHYDPPSTLEVPEHPVPRAKFPFVDVHSHQFDLDEAQVRASSSPRWTSSTWQSWSTSPGADSSAGPGPTASSAIGLKERSYLLDAIALTERVAPGRIVHFTNVDFSQTGGPDWPAAALADLEADVAAGARGLKIYKGLGMDTEDVAGQRIAVNDARLRPIWEACARLGIPVLIHTADPAPFWQSKTKDNERLYEMIEVPGRWRDPAENTPWEQLIGEQHDLFRANPQDHSSSMPISVGWATTSDGSGSSWTRRRTC